VTREEWWALALRDAPAAAAAWRTVPAADRKTIRAAAARARTRAGLLDEHVRELGRTLGAVVDDGDLDAVIASWPSAGGLSEHIELELAAAFHRGRPLAPGEPVPGCGCPACTEIAADHPVRTAMHRRLQERLAAARDAHDATERRRAWAQQVAKARAVPITQIVALLGLGPPEGHGKEVRVRCPFHEDAHPSLSLSTEKNKWFCHPCGDGGDGIGLVMRVEQLGFAAAVRRLAP
jgi:hypothetical protein